MIVHRLNPISEIAWFTPFTETNVTSILVRKKRLENGGATKTSVYGTVMIPGVNEGREKGKLIQKVCDHARRSGSFAEES